MMAVYTVLLVWTLLMIGTLVSQTLVESFEFRAPFPDGLFPTDLLSRPETDAEGHTLVLPIDVHDWNVASMGSLIYFCVVAKGKVALNSTYLNMPIRLNATVFYESFTVESTTHLKSLTSPIQMDVGKTVLRDIFEFEKSPFCFYTTACAIWQKLQESVATAELDPFAHSVEFQFMPDFDYPFLGPKPKGLELYAFVGANGGGFTQEAVRGAPYYEAIRRTGVLLNPLGDMVLVRGESKRCATTVTGVSEIGWFRRVVTKKRSHLHPSRRDLYQCESKLPNSVVVMESHDLIGELFYSPAYGTWENYEPRVLQCGYFVMV